MRKVGDVVWHLIFTEDWLHIYKGVIEDTDPDDCTDVVCDGNRCLSFTHEFFNTYEEALMGALERIKQ